MKRVLFICIGNACRSQIAEAWMNHFIQEQGRDDIKVFSAGSSPLGYIPEETIATMQEIGISLKGHWSKRISELPTEEFDYVISLCGDRCPYVPAENHIDWPTPDPFGDGLEGFRRVRDRLRDQVKQLLADLM